MPCQRCNSSRIISVNGKTSDMCDVHAEGHVSDGYVPYDLHIGGGDYLMFSFCLDCGQIRGTFPIPPDVVSQTLGSSEVMDE